MRARCASIITSERVDIVHAQSAAAAWSARKATAKLPVRLVTSFGDRLDTPSWLGRHFQAALARGERVIAPSSFVAQAMIERYKLRPERITVIPRRVDTALFSPAAVNVERIAAIRRAWGVLPQPTHRAGAGPHRAVERADRRDRRGAAHRRQRWAERGVRVCRRRPQRAGLPQRHPASRASARHRHVGAGGRPCAATCRPRSRRPTSSSFRR